MTPRQLIRAGIITFALLNVGLLGIIAALLLPRRAEPTTAPATANAIPVHPTLFSVASLADGDTLLVLDRAGKEHRVRLYGIDAPQAGQPFYDEACNALKEKISKADVRLERRGQVRDGRTVLAIVTTPDGRNINREMVEDGWAWHYGSDHEWAAAERSARTAKRGLWAETRPIAPWDFLGPAR